METTSQPTSVEDVTRGENRSPVYGEYGGRAAGAGAQPRAESSELARARTRQSCDANARFSRIFLKNEALNAVLHLKIVKLAQGRQAMNLQTLVAL
jgi:hypothetical protein